MVKSEWVSVKILLFFKGYSTFSHGWYIFSSIQSKDWRSMKSAKINFCK